jgi:hypothetical protein
VSSVKPDLVTVLEYHGFHDLPLHRNPNGVKVKCHYHGDRIASAILNEKDQRYTCMACDRRGDSWALLMAEDGLTFPEAIDFAVEQGWVDRDENGQLVGGVSHTPSTPARGRRSGRRTRLLRRRRR